MFHLCLFGGQAGELDAQQKVYLTAFGGCELRWPTIAKQMTALRQRGTPSAAAPIQYFLTLFGGTEITAPTLAHEFLDLQNALRSGQLTLDDWDRSIVRIGDIRRSGSLTLFGNFNGDGLPGEDAELDDLALNRHLGYISDEAAELLMRAVGARGSSRAAVVRQAVATTMVRSA
jgi:hypothetical protein